MSKSEVYDYIWHEFDQHHVDFPEPATERMFISRFKRKYVTYLLWHFSSRILTLDDKFELPNNSILHVADNFEHFDTPVDTPDLDNNLFVQNESFLKYLLHIRTFNTTGPIHYDDKYIYRQAGLPANLMKYRSMNGNKYKYLRDFKDIPRKESALTIINHNPLFRIKMFGRLQKYRRVMQILASIFNTAIELAPLGKQQYIVLPWGDEYFGISDFIRSRDNLTYATIKHPESLQYIFMMHLVNYFWNTATTSMFSMIPRESLDKIYIVLQHNDKYIFYNLNALKDINENNRVYRKVVNQLNWLAVLGMPDANITPEVQELVNKHKAAELLDDPAKEEEDVPAVKLPTERKLKEKEDDGTAVDSDIVVITPKNEKKEPANEKEADAMEQVTAAAIKHAAEAVKQTQQSTAQRQAAKPSRTTVSIAIPEVHASITDTKNHTDINAVIKRAVNVTKLADNMLKKDVDTDYMDQVDRAADQFIEDRETLTPAAKRYFKSVAVKYKKLQIDNVPLEKLLKDTSEITLSDTKIDPKKLGNVADPSSLQCTLAAYDQDYIHKTYRKHIAGILTSFQKNGVYLVGLKTEQVLTDLHNYTEYSCQYEDIDGKKSTIKFKLPNIDSEGCVVIDGVKQAVRKQRAPLPIVKIAADTVALTSNYNKARVKRCNNVAHSFIAYVHRLFTDKTKTNVSITYGNELVNLPLSYEYTSLALKYAYVRFTGRDNSQYELCFSYSKRNKHFDGKESLLQELEAQYGVYFGKTKTTWLFVNNTNRVSIISKTKGEVSIDFSLLEICKLAVNEEAYIKLKPLTEWANFEVLDGTFPVIFMLAYRYGLRAILDYLGVKYTITENRSKTIVGENTIEGTESFDVKASLARVQYLNELNKSGIDKNKIIIGASAALVAYGLLDTPNKDLDISIEDNYKKTLINKGILTRNTEDGATHWVVSNTHIDAGVDGPDQQKFSYTELKKLGITIINGYAFISLEGMIKFYEKCKELFPDDKEKQQKYNDRIALIEQALAAGTEAFVQDKISGDIPSYDGEYEDTGKDTIVYTNDESVLPAMEAMRRLVRPRLGDVTLYLTAKSDANENQETTIQLRGVIITVKLGTTATVKRQVVAYNGSTFTSKDKDTLPRKLVDKLSDYFNCGRSKISRANVEWLPADKPLPPEVAKTRIMTAVEYSKLSSKIKGDFNKVRVPKRSGMADYSAEMEDLATTIKYNSRPNDIHIKFADRVLHINRYPLVHSLIVAGLCNYDLTKYSLSEFESRDVYYRLLMDKKMSINLVKGLDSFYDLFVDNITYSVLKMMHEPTNVRDLLIRSVTLISTFDHEPPSSGKNHRIRGYEQFAGILYNELSRSFAQYQAKHNANNKFSTNPDSVYLRIIQNGAMVPAESGSPIEDIKRMSAMTYGGTGGRNAESFVQSDRHYEASDIGVVCESTVDNKNAGFNASVSYNPNIANTLGMSETKTVDELQPSQILSPHALLFPFSCNDD